MAEAARAGDARRLAGQRRLVDFASLHASTQPTLLNFFQTPVGAGKKRGREDGFETDEEEEGAVAEAAAEAEAVAGEEAEAGAVEEAEEEETVEEEDATEKTPQQKYEAVWALFEPSLALRLGQFAPFKALQLELAADGLKACGCLICPFKMRGIEHFSRNLSKNDGHLSTCKACLGRVATNAAAEARRNLVAARVVARGTVKNSGAIEDEAAMWLKSWLETKWPQLIVEILPEFRRADLAVRLAHWVGDDGEDLWLPVQLKSSGIFKKDGVTLKPNDSKNYQKGGGSATFAGCTGYDGMLMLFVKTRRDDNGSDIRSLWCCWGDEVCSTRVFEGTSDGSTGRRPSHARTKSLLPVSDTQHVAPVDLAAPSDLWEALTSKPELGRPWISLWMKVEMKNQLKEVAMMLSMDQISKVVIPKGNQTAVDCTWKGFATQVKTARREGFAPTIHSKHGVLRRPYADTDGIEQLVECLVVESNGDYYLMHAVQLLDALVEHGVFATKDSAGRGGFTVPWGCYSEWITGAPVPRPRKRNAWLQGPTCGWRAPVRLTPNEYLTSELLAEVALVAANPAAMPTESV